jgi:ribosomal protein L22
MKMENKENKSQVEEKIVSDKPKEKTEVIEVKKNEEKKTEEKKKEEKKIIKKDCAVVRGVSLPISQKFSSSVCKMIRKKEIGRAIKMLEEVLKFKRAVPMNNMEIPHRKGKGMMSGRYPLSVCTEFIHILKQLKANAIVNNIEEPVIIFLAKADRASCPFRREGRRAKRTNVYLEARTKQGNKISEKTKEKKK